MAPEQWTDTMPNYAPSRFRTLGTCWVIYGAIRLLVALWLVGFSTTATVMFGALLTRVPDPYSLMSAFHLLYLVTIVWSFAAGLLGIVAGLALIGSKSAGRSLGIIAAFLSISEIPLGVTIGTYTLIVLLPARGESLYGSSARAA
jgi:hypothetical protein